MHAGGWEGGMSAGGWGGGAVSAALVSRLRPLRANLRMLRSRPRFQEQRSGTMGTFSITASNQPLCVLSARPYELRTTTTMPTTRCWRPAWTYMDASGSMFGGTTGYDAPTRIALE